MSNKTLFSDPKRYSELNLPVSADKADTSITAFIEALKELRFEHGIPDVHVILRVNIETESGDEAAGMVAAHIGAVQEGESMCAWGLARAQEDRRRFVDHAKVSGARYARGAS